MLLKTSERKKEILLSAGAGNMHAHSSSEKDISGFTETAGQQVLGQVNPEDKECAIKQLQQQISHVSPSDIGEVYSQQMEILGRH